MNLEKHRRLAELDMNGDSSASVKLARESMRAGVTPPNVIFYCHNALDNVGDLSTAELSETRVALRWCVDALNRFDRNGIGHFEITYWAEWLCDVINLLPALDLEESPRRRKLKLWIDALAIAKPRYEVSKVDLWWSWLQYSTGPYSGFEHGSFRPSFPHGFELSSGVMLYYPPRGSYVSCSISRSRRVICDGECPVLPAVRWNAHPKRSADL